MSTSCRIFLKQVESLFPDLQEESNQRLTSAYLKELIVLTLLLEHLQGIYDVKYRLMKAWVALSDVDKIIYQHLVDKVHVAPLLLNQKMVLALIDVSINNLYIVNPETHEKIIDIIPYTQ